MQKIDLPHIDGLLVTNPTNIRYLTGFTGVTPDERDAYLLVAKGKSYLFTNALYIEQAKTLKTGNLTVVEITREAPLSKKLATIVGDLKLSSLSFEADNLTVSEFKTLRNEMPSVALVGKMGAIERMRLIKTDVELTHIKRAAKLTDACFDVILGKIKPGVNETTLAWEIESYFRKNGGTCAFSPIVAFGAHSSQPHYSIANSTRPGLAMQGQALRKNDIVLFDLGAKVNGYCGDLTRMVVVGKAKDEWQKAYRAVLEAQLAALMYLDNGGLSGAEADQIARATIEKFGFPSYPHSLGHGVGLDIHEAPRLTMKKDVRLKPNMCVSVEPGIYLEGKFGVRIEDLVCIQDKGIDVLSHAAKELIVL